MGNMINEVSESVLNSDRPYVPSGSHPIETGQYLLGTNEIDRMGEVVYRWIENRAPGGIIYGKPRMGKTRAILYLMKALPDEFGLRTPVFLIKCRQYKQPNENIFFEDLLKDVGHGIVYSGSKSKKRERLTNFLLEQADLSGQTRIIMFFDDAQRLFELQYGWLMDIYNELDLNGISLTALLIGQEELRFQRSAFIKTKKSQIVGRFMVHEYEFSGVKTVKELKTCLSCYDKYSEYPAESGWSFTRYFMPDAFKHGFKLENCCDDLFVALRETRQENGLKQTFEIPMLYLTLTVEYVLKHFGIKGSNLSNISRAQWKEAIRNSGYIKAEIYQNVV